MNDTLEHMIATYEPSESAAELIHATKIALLVGISGAGKDTIKKRTPKKPTFSRYCFAYHPRATGK